MSVTKKIVFYLLLASTLYGQDDQFRIGLWHVQQAGGSLMLEGTYRSQETTLRNDLVDKPSSSLYSGKLNLYSRGYLWHPGFMKLDLEGEYQPSAQNNEYLVVPTRAENRTAERVRLNATFFEKRPFYLSVFTDYNHNYTNREYATNVEMQQLGYGATLYYRNGYTPFSIGVYRNDWKQTELKTTRQFHNDRRGIRFDANDSFLDYDDHRLNINYEDFSRSYAGGSSVRNQITSINLRNNIGFDRRQESAFTSYLWHYRQAGDDPLNRLQANETIRFKLPENFRTTGQYQYSDYTAGNLESTQHDALIRLEHQLFLSLASRVHYGYQDIRQTAFNEYLNSYGLGFDYRKKIPGGVLNLHYTFRNRNENHRAGSSVLSVLDEEINLRDGDVTLLSAPFIDPLSIRVTDQTGTIIYQENIDYLLVLRGDYIEIQRLPGGQIDEGTTVYVDYRATQQNSYRYNALSNNYGIRVNLLENLLEVYFNLNEHVYNNIQQADFRVLKTISQRVFGVRTGIGGLSAGIEHDDYNSNILPYSSTRYFISWSDVLFQRLSTALTANHRDYTLTGEQLEQKFTDISGRFLYSLTSQVRLNLETGYRFQQGKGIDLNLATLRSEVIWQVRQMVLSAGYEAYRRDFSGEKILYNGGFARIERRF